MAFEGFLIFTILISLISLYKATLIFNITEKNTIYSYNDNYNMLLNKNK